MVRSQTVTEKRRCTSAHKSTQRQRLTLCSCGFGPSIPPLAQLRPLLFAQPASRAGRRARQQSVDAISIVAQHPVAQCLPIHAGHARGILARAASDNQSNRQQPPCLVRVVTLRRTCPKVGRRVVRSADHQCHAHDLLRRHEPIRQQSESYFGGPGNPQIVERVSVSGAWHQLRGAILRRRILPTRREAPHLLASGRMSRLVRGLFTDQNCGVFFVPFLPALLPQGGRLRTDCRLVLGAILHAFGGIRRMNVAIGPRRGGSSAAGRYRACETRCRRRWRTAAARPATWKCRQRASVGNVRVIDSTIFPAPHCAAGARGETQGQALDRWRGGFLTRFLLRSNAHGLWVGVALTEDEAQDHTACDDLLDERDGDPGLLSGDQGNDGDVVRLGVRNQALLLICRSSGTGACSTRSASPSPHCVPASRPLSVP